MNKQTAIDENSSGVHYIIKKDCVKFLESFMLRNGITYQDFMTLTIGYKQTKKRLLVYCSIKRAEKIIAKFMKQVDVIKMFTTEYEDDHIINLKNFMNSDDLFAKIFATNKIKNINSEVGGNNLLHSASYSDNINLLRFLLQNGADINYKNNFGHTPLYLSIINGALKNSIFLIENGADLNIVYRNNESVLMIAIRYDLEDIVKTIILHGADLNIKNNTGYNALTLAFSIKMYNIVHMLLNHGSKDIYWDKLSFSYFDDKTEEILLLSNPETFADYVNKKDYVGNTSLSIICKDSDVRSVKLLLKYGADRNTLNNSKITPICYAVAKKDTEMVKLLVESGCIFRKHNMQQLNGSFKNYKEILGPYRDKLYVCRQKCWLLLCANKLATESTIHIEIFPRELIRVIVDFFIDYIYTDIFALKNLG